MVIIVYGFIEVFIDAKMNWTERCIYDAYDVEAPPLYLDPDTDKVTLQLLDPLNKV